MKYTKKPLSILLSLLMILSVFTIIPATTASAAADGDTVTGSVNKWVKGVTNGPEDAYFTGLYSNVIFLRVNPNEDFDYDFDSAAVWNRTGNMTYAGKDTCYIYDWNDGYGEGHLAASWAYEELLDGEIRLVDQLYMYKDADRADWYAYTWENNVTLTYRDTVSPTYDASAQKPYQHGVKAHYEYNGLKFKSNGDGTYSQITDDDLSIPYFEFKQHGSTAEDSLIKLEKCNSTDAEIIVPEIIPANYPNDVLKGQSFSVIAGGAFYNKTNLTSITIGDNVNHLGADYVDGLETLGTIGAFEGCTSLESVTVGSHLNYVEDNAFYHCSALTDLTTTSTLGGYSDFTGVRSLVSSNNGLTVHCYHNSGISNALTNYSNIVTFDYLDAHTYQATWNWSGFDTSQTVTATVLCSVCGEESDALTATVDGVVDTPATCDATGSGHYQATVTYDGQTFTDTDNNSHTYTIPKIAHNLTEHPAHAATCTEGGNNAYWSCDLCGKFFSDANGENEIEADSWITSATGHDWDIDNAQWEYYDNYDKVKIIIDCKKCDAQHITDRSKILDDQKEATCNEDGYIRYRYAYYMLDIGIPRLLIQYRTDVIPALGHDMTHHPAASATLSTDGNTEYWSCSRCGKYFSDEDGENEIEENSWIIEKTAVAYIAPDYYTNNFGLAINQAVSHSLGAKVIELLKDVDDSVVFAPSFSNYSVKVKKNGHNLTIVAPENYILTETGPDADGITIYSIAPDGKVETSYLDENDDEQTVRATPITASTTTLTAGWYVAEGDVTITGEVALSGDVKLILSDGSNLTATVAFGDTRSSGNLTIYRQNGNSLGTLSTNEISVNTFTLIGGKIVSKAVNTDSDILIAGGEFNVDARVNGQFAPNTLNAVSSGGDITITGGEVSVYGNAALLATNGTITISGGDSILRGYGAGLLGNQIAITGGKVSATAAKEDNSSVGIKSYGSISLSWTDAENDYIYADGYDSDVTFLRPFKDQNNKIYPIGTVDPQNLGAKGFTPATAYVSGYTVTLGDEIAVNYYVYADSALYSDGITASYAYGDGDYRATHTDLTPTVKSTELYGANYKIICRVNARSMSEAISLTVNSGGAAILTDNDYKIIDYAQNLAGREAKWKNLMCSMLDYGGAVQTHFGYRTDDLASDYIDTIDSAWTNNAPDSLDDTSTLKTADLSAYGVSYAGATMVATAQTSIRLFFDKTGSGDMPTVTVNGETIAWKHHSGLNKDYIEISGIHAKSIFDEYTIVVGGSDALTYIANGYYNTAMSGSFGESMIGVMKTIYQYYDNAKEMLSNTNS